MEVAMRFSSCRRLFLVVFWLIVATALSACQEPEEDKIITVGVINYRPPTEPTLDGFKAGMEALGHIEGENIKYVYHGSVETSEELMATAEGFVEADVDLILAISSPAASAAKVATAGTDIPIVFAPVTDPLAIGLVDRLDQPGENLTGVTNGGSEPRRRHPAGLYSLQSQ
jgi:putative ABC transport system substrate-binding protein